jgi:ABC-type Fe3+/spermidine/putrescine transport system ATPase subunit
VSNLLAGDVAGADRVRIADGSELRVAPGALNGHTGRVAVGIRPEKIGFGPGGENTLAGQVVESAYIGVATQYIVETGAGRLQVFEQNTNPGARPAGPVELSFDAEATFVVEEDS